MSDLELFHGPNAGYVLDLYEQYREDPAAVDAETRQFLDSLLERTGDLQAQIDALLDGSDSEEEPAAPAAEESHAATNGATAAAEESRAVTNGATATRQQKPYPSDSAQPAATDTRGTSNGVNTAPAREPQQEPTVPHMVSESDLPFDIPQVVNAARLVRFIREIGHLDARIDPLGSEPPGDPGLELEPQGLTREMLAAMPPSVVMSALAEGTENALEAVERLRRVYSGSIGYDDEHVQSDEERQWLRDVAESNRFFQDFDDHYKHDLLERLTDVETFERFLHQTFLGQKRFSIEGTDMLVPMLDAIIHHAAEAGTHEVVMGMAHRGRLNVLAHNMGKTYSAILAEFQGPNNYNRATYLGWTGDVKYHLGARKAYREGAVYEMPLTLVANPSHLEFVNPVAKGRARAAQEIRNRPGQPQKESHASLPILIHGDASFPGQGIVAETLNLSRLQGYHVGGTIHIIINNQIGFTTEASDSRSTHYAGDMAKGFDIPLVHVNADDPEACIAAARMAWTYREHFGKDFMIDLVGYRRWGHNEGDEPAYTQPEMYELIANHPTVREIWARKLVNEGVISDEQVNELQQRAQDRLQRALHEVQTRGRIDAMMSVSVASMLHRPVAEPLALSEEYLNELNNAMLTFPKSFNVHPKLNRAFDRRRNLQADSTLDWAHAEALAFASILADGTPIRLTGQDTERGTFSQRHLVLHDVETGENYVPLQQIPQSRASFAIFNSPLSESAALGFEYGFSIHAPETLVMWEAQFGDFANGAQVIIDQFIVSGHAKWGQQTALVMLLPHGYEGQGPEHSNARPERFLQLAADNNLRVVNCTTAAQYFHLLRRQAALLYADPRPLIVMTPKSLLRHPLASSTLTDLAHGRFLPVLIPEIKPSRVEQVSRLILCSGKVYVDLMSKQGRSDGQPALPEHTAIARVEELYPFPANELEGLLGWYPNLQEIIWLQEEPANMGAWHYIRPHLRGLLRRMQPGNPVPLYYCGRAESASTAEGSHSQHETEQSRILHEAIHGTFERHTMYSR